MINYPINNKLNGNIKIAENMAMPSSKSAVVKRVASAVGAIDGTGDGAGAERLAAV